MRLTMKQKPKVNNVSLAVISVMELVLAYLLITLAINDGNLILYAITILLVINFIENIVLLVKRIIKSHAQRRTA